jgi:hypothetical protein
MHRNNVHRSMPWGGKNPGAPGIDGQMFVEIRQARTHGRLI